VSQLFSKGVVDWLLGDLALSTFNRALSGGMSSPEAELTRKGPPFSFTRIAFPAGLFFLAWRAYWGVN
jgi:hypothetical protein